MDLRGIEILAKSYDGDVATFSYDDLISDPSIKLSLRDGDYLPTEFYYALFDEATLRSESAETQAKLANYLNRGASNPAITIEIPNTDPIVIDLQVSAGDLSPLELLHALDMPRGTAMVKRIGKLSYRPSETFDPSSLILIYKNSEDQLQLLKGRDIEKYFTLDDRQFEQERALLMAKVQSQVLESLQEPILGNRFNLSRFATNVTTPTEPQSAETYISLSGDGGHLFIPVTISNAMETKSLDRLGNLAITDVVKTQSGDRDSYKFKLDIRDISALKELDLQFTGQGTQDIQVKEIIESDGFNRRYIQPADIFSPSADSEVKLSSELYAGNKYFITVDASSDGGEITVKSALSGTMGVEPTEFNVSDLLFEPGDSTGEDIPSPEEPTEEPQTPTEEPQQPTEPTEDPNAEVDNKGDQEVTDPDNKTDAPEDKTDQTDDKTDEKTEEPQEPTEQPQEPEQEPDETPQAPEDQLLLDIAPLEIGDMQYLQVGQAQQQGVIANLKVKKVDENGTILPGATIQLTNQATNETTTFVSGTEEYHTMPLTPGYYTLEETQAPEGYTKSDKKYSVTVDDAGNIYYEEDTTPAGPLGMEAPEENEGFLSSIFDFLKLGASGEPVVKVASYEMVPSERGSDVGAPVVYQGKLETLKLNLQLEISTAAQIGDTFTIELDEKLAPTRLMPENQALASKFKWTPPSITYDGREIATGVYNYYTNTIVYTFIDTIGSDAISVSSDLTIDGMEANRLNAMQTGYYNFVNTIDGVKQTSYRFYIDYSLDKMDNPYPEYDGQSYIAEFNPETKKLRYVSYIYPTTDDIDLNRNTNFLLYEYAKAPSGEYLVTKSDTNVYLSKADVKFYKIPKDMLGRQTLMPDSMVPDTTMLAGFSEDIYANNVQDINGNFYRRAYLGDTANEDGYVVVADIPYNPDAKEIIIGSRWADASVAEEGINFNSYIGIKDNSIANPGEDVVGTRETDVTIVNQSIPEQGKGSFTVNKVDHQGDPLDGASFELKDIDTGATTTLNSSIGGKFFFNNIAPGSYTLREVSAPNGYNKTFTQWSVFVNSQGRVFIDQIGGVDPGTVVSGQDVTSRINLTSSSMDFNDHADGISGDGKLQMGSLENDIQIDLDMSIPGTVNPGDYFILEESDTLHYNMLQPDKINYNEIRASDGTVLARAALGDEFNISDGSHKKAYYVFTDAVKNLQDITMSLTLARSVNMNYAAYDTLYDFYVKLGDYTIEKQIEIQYPYPKVNQQVNVDANYLYTNDQTGKYTQLGYINPLRYNMSGETTISVYPVVMAGQFNMADIKPDKTRVTLYRFDPAQPVPRAVIFEPNILTEVPANQYSVQFDQANGSVQVKVNGINSDAYLLKIDSEMKYPQDGFASGILGQWVQVENGGYAARKGTAIGTNTDGGSGTGGGQDDYTPPSLTVENIPSSKGRFEINKIGKDGDVETQLGGAVFELTGANIAPMQIMSDETGKVVFDNLSEGTYKLKEISAPEGYIKSNKTWEVKVDSNGVTTVHEVQPVQNSADALDILGISDEFLFPGLMAMPPGTQDKDVVISDLLLNQPYGNSDVTTSAKYLGDNKFEVKLDITAGDDVGSAGHPVDVLIMVQGNQMTQAVKNGLINNLRRYGQNTRVALKVYNNYNRFADTMDRNIAFTDPTTIESAITSYAAPGVAPANLDIRNAFIAANGVFAGTNQALGTPRANAEKVLIHIGGQGVVNGDGIIKTNANGLRNNGVRIYNYYVGINNLNYVNYWNNALAINNTVNASVDTENVLNRTIPKYEDSLKKAVENATFQVSFNDNFEFNRDATTIKTDPTTPNNGRWHYGYNSGSNSIDLYENELTLNADQTASMTFTVTAKGDLQRNVNYSIINGITYKPNSDSDTYVITPPTVRINEGTFNLVVHSTHTGEVPFANVSFDLLRSSNGGEAKFVDRYSVRIGESLNIRDLPMIDQSGNAYSYSIAKASPSKQRVKIESITPSEGLNKDNATVEISTSTKIGFNIGLDWGGLKAFEDINVKLSNGQTIILNETNDYYYEDLNITSDFPTIVSAIGLEGYIYTVRDNGNGSYTLLANIQDTPVLNVVNEKQSTKLSILKVDAENKNRLLPGATFTLNGTNVNYSKTIVTEEDGRATFTDLQPGEYLLKETIAPAGYKYEGLEWTVKVEAGEITVVPKSASSLYKLTDGAERYLSIGSYPQGMKLHQTISQEADKFMLKVSVEKLIDEDWAAYFILNFDNDNFIIINQATGQEITQFSEYVSTGIASGDDVFTFEVIPKNMASTDELTPVKEMIYSNLTINDSQYMAKIQKNEISALENIGNDTFEYTVGNKKEAELTIYKTDEETAKALEGAVFKLTGISETVSDYDKILTTKFDGKATFSALEPGDYTLEELQAPKDYLVTQGPWKVKVDEAGIVYVGPADQVNVTKGFQVIPGEEYTKYDYWNNPILRFKQEITAIPNDPDGGYNLRLTVTRLANYYERADLELIFNTEHFDVYQNGQLIEDFTDWVDVYKNFGYVNYDFKIVPKYKYSGEIHGPIKELWIWNPRTDAAGYDELVPDTNKSWIKVVDHTETIESPIEELQPGEDGSIQLPVTNKKDDGTGGFILTKTDDAGNALTGAEFRLFNSKGEEVKTNSKGEPITINTGPDGKITYTELPYDIYSVRETKAPDGYIINPDPIKVVISRDWRVPADPINPKSICPYIDIDESSISVKSSEGSTEVVYPNKSESTIINFSFNISGNVKINPGDFFTLKLGDNLDLDGIGLESSENFDLVMANGLLAKAEIGADRRTIKYTFTDYVENYKVETCEVSIPVYINRELVKFNQDNVPIQVSFGANGQFDSFTRYINVNYDPYVNDPSTVQSYMTKFNPENGEFTLVIYANHQGYSDRNRYVDFWADQNYRDLNFEIYKTRPTDPGLPPSFGVNYDIIDAMPKNVTPWREGDQAKWRIGLGNDWSNASYVIVVTGVATDKGKVFNTHSKFYDEYQYYGDIYGRNWQWDTWVNFYSPDIVSEGEIKINAPNVPNKIEYTKVEGGISGDVVDPEIPPNPEGGDGPVLGPETPPAPEDGGGNMIKPPVAQQNQLSGAEFELRKDDGTGNFVKVDGSEKTSADATGKFAWEKLAPGNYQVWETKAPSGFVKPADFVSSFTVNAEGTIVNILNNTTIIINEKPAMKFFMDKIWNDGGEEKHIRRGTLELELTAPDVFPGDLVVDANAPVKDRQYKITKISEDRKTITIEVPLDNPGVYEFINGVDGPEGIRIDVPTTWPSGNYMLKETKAPAGYVKTDEVFTINIDQENFTITHVKDNSETGNLYNRFDDATGDGVVTENLGVLKIENKPGEYPSTGGMGTMLFVVVGVAMMAIAYIGYRKRRGDVS